MRIEEHARLEVKLPDGRNFTVSETDLVNDSLSVSSRCVNGNTFTFGCVSPAQLSVRFRIRGIEVSRYDMYGAEMILYRWFGQEPPPGGGKSGVFNVISAVRQHDIFTVSAADNICWLDGTAFSTNGESGANSVYGNMGNAVYTRLGRGGLLWHALDAMGIIVSELAGGLSFRAEVEKIDGSSTTMIPNARTVFTGFGAAEPPEGFGVRLVLISDDEQSDNLRDYVSWLAAYMGGFVCADHDGVIEFRLFQTAYYNTPTVLQYSDFQADSLEIAGFRISLYKNKVVTEDNHFFETAYDVQPSQGTILTEIVEKQNPFLEYIYLYKKSISEFGHITGALLFYQYHIPIRPFTGIYHGTQYLKLGQYIHIMDESGTPHNTVITNIEWKFRGGQKISCVGEDSRTLSEARKRTQAIRTGERLKTQLSRLENRVTASNSQFGSDISAVSSRVSAIEGQNLNGRISALEVQNLNGRLNDLAARVQALENGG